MTELSLTVSRKINASPEKLFNAWLDPKMLARFMLPGEGMTVPSAKTDPVEGGRFDIVMKAGDHEIPHHGIYKKISPHSELVFTWQSVHSVDGSTVTLTFEPTQGGTEITLHQVKFASEDSVKSHQGGWTSILDALAKAV